MGGQFSPEMYEWMPRMMLWKHVSPASSMASDGVIFGIYVKFGGCTLDLPFPSGGRNMPQSHNRHAMNFEGMNWTVNEQLGVQLFTVSLHIRIFLHPQKPTWNPIIGCL